MLLSAAKLIFIDRGDRRKFQKHCTTMSRVIEGRGHCERVTVTERRMIEDGIEPFEQAVTRRMFRHQVASGGDVNAVVGTVEHRRRRSVARVC